MDQDKSQTAFFLSASSSPKSRETRQKYYKSWALRLSPLIALFVVILALIGLVEYTLRTFPVSDPKSFVQEVLANASTATLEKRYSANYISTVTTTAILTPHISLEGPHETFWLAVGTVTIKPEQTPVPSNPLDDIFETSNGTSNDTLNDTSQYLVYVFTNEEYFVGAFLPTLIAVLFCMPWMIIDFKAKSLEPFHQLKKSQGAWAHTTFLMDYSSPIALIAPFKALFAMHWTPLLTSTLTICTIFLAPLAPEFIGIRMDGECSATTTGCIPSLDVFVPAGRAIEALLGLMAVLALLLLIQMFRYNSGIFAEPLSIAGLASLFHNPRVVWDFRAVAMCATRRKAFKSLGKRKYKLDYYIELDGSKSYGFVPVDPMMVPSHASDGLAGSQNLSMPQLLLPQRLAFNYPHRFSAIPLMCFLMALIAVIIYYRLRNDNGAFEHFMDSQSFGVKFVFTLIGVIISWYWGSIFRDVSDIEAFSQLARGASKPHSSILAPKSSSPVTSIFSSLYHQQFFLALISTTALLSEPLTVCLSNINFDTSTTYSAWTVSTWLSVSILGFMITTLAFLIFRKEPKLPFGVNTIGGVLCYLANSSLLESFKDLECLDTRDRNRRVEEMGGRYGMWETASSEMPMIPLVVIDVEPVGS